MSDEWYTPKWLFDELNLQFDMDVACKGSDYSHCPANIYITPEIDGLVTAWQGLIWMNPPYSKPTPWIEKFIKHGNGIALVPFSKSKWFVNLWNSDALIMPLPVNLKFDRPDGSNQQIFMQTCLVALGDEAKLALKTISQNNVDLAKCR